MRACRRFVRNWPTDRTSRPGPLLLPQAPARAQLLGELFEFALHFQVAKWARLGDLAADEAVEELAAGLDDADQLAGDAHRLVGIPGGGDVGLQGDAGGGDLAALFVEVLAVNPRRLDGEALRIEIGDEDLPLVRGLLEECLGLGGEVPGALGDGVDTGDVVVGDCLLYTSPSPRDRTRSRMPSSA